MRATSITRTRAPAALPTDKGYRLYVESITEAVSLAPVEQLMIRHQFGQVEFASEQWFRLAAATLAASTHVGGHRDRRQAAACRVRRIDLVAAGDRLASLVRGARGGPIKQVLLPLDPGTDERASRRSRGELSSGSPAWPRGVAAVVRALQLDDETDRLTACCCGRVERTALMRDYDASAVEDVFSGPAQRHGRARVRPVRDAPAHLRGAPGPGVPGRPDARADPRGRRARVHRQRERPHRDARRVAGPRAYGRAGRAVGVVGVLGPTRMAYPHAISTVRYVSGLMNELVDHLYA